MIDLYRALEREEGLPIQPAPLEEAQATWVRWRKGVKAPLLTPPHGNPKFTKSNTPNYGLSLAAAEGGGTNVCRYSTHDCRAGCVTFAGRGATRPVQYARQQRTRFLARHPQEFVTLLADETHRASLRHDGDVVLRLNVFSDLPWERIIPWYFDWAWDLQFYDYTKWPPGLRPNLPPNYDLTLSVSEAWDERRMLQALDEGHRLAVVVPVGQHDTITEWRGWPCANGDEGDLRYLDPKPGIVLLKAKGRLRRSPVGGFVRDMEQGGGP